MAVGLMQTKNRYKLNLSGLLNSRRLLDLGELAHLEGLLKQRDGTTTKIYATGLALIVNV